MNRKTIITTLLVLVATTSIVAQDLIKTATAPISFSKKDFADTIKIKVLDGAVIVRGGYSASGDRRANKEPSV